MTRIGIVGDTHGNSQVTLTILDKLNSQGIKEVHSVGDFGFWPGNPGMHFLSQVNTHLGRLGQTLYVTPGNHEDYNFINALLPNEDGWLVARSHILVAPRGHRWERDGVSFVSLGGAPSVDRSWRLESQRRSGYPVWWAAEDITQEDMDRTIVGGYADIMITHDAPFGVPSIEKGITGNPHSFTEQDLRYAYEGRCKMREVVEAVRPKIFFHGHYHWKVDDKLEIFNENTGLDDVTLIKGLASDGVPNSYGVLDLKTLEFEFRK